MNIVPSKYQLIFIPTLFLICIVNIFFITISPEIMVITNSHLFGSEMLSKDNQNLELKAEESTSRPDGLKVEIVEISSLCSFDSGDDHLSYLNLQNKIYSKKKCSLISHSNLIIYKTRHLSPLITKLQI